MRTRVSCALLIALLLAAGGPARAYWIQHTNNALDPAVSPEQFRPAPDGSRPTVGKPPAPITITVLPLPAGWSDATLAAVLRGLDPWRVMPGASTQITIASPAPNAVSDGDWRSRYEREDGRNTIEFITRDWPGFFGPSVIAVTVPKLDSAGRILESDLFCNAQDYRWMVFPREGAFPGLAVEDRVDVEAIITHETGHFLGLGHSQYPWAAMYWNVGLADTRARHLSADDREGVRSLYPASAETVPPPSLWGVHADSYPGGTCGLDTLTLLSAQVQYVYRSAPLSGPHELISDSDPSFAYCLFGSGFSRAFFYSMDLRRNGSLMNAVTGATYLDPNFVKAVARNGSGGFPPLATGAYDLVVRQSPGGFGSLDQGLFVNVFGNGIPAAVIQAEVEATEPRTWVGLDGSGSADPDGSPLQYFWEIVESPQPNSAKLAAVAGAQTSIYLAEAGLYVVRLVVNDGTVDSVADQAVIRATFTRFDADSGDEFSPLGCALTYGRAANLNLGGICAILLAFGLPPAGFLIIRIFVRKK